MNWSSINGCFISNSLIPKQLISLMLGAWCMLDSAWLKAHGQVGLGRRHGPWPLTHEPWTTKHSISTIVKLLAWSANHTRSINRKIGSPPPKQIRFRFRFFDHRAAGYKDNLAFPNCRNGKPGRQKFRHPEQTIWLSFERFGHHESQNYHVLKCPGKCLLELRRGVA